MSERWGFAIVSDGKAYGWIPPRCTGILRYEGGEMREVLYDSGDDTGMPNAQLEPYCHNKYKIDPVARAVLANQPAGLEEG